MEGVLLSSSSVSVSRCVLRLRVPPAQSKCVFEQTNKLKSIIISNNPKTKGGFPFAILLQRERQRDRGAVVVAVSGNTQPQEPLDDDDDDDEEQDTEPLAFVALSDNGEEEEEEEEEDAIDLETKPIPKVVSAASSTPSLDHSSTTQSHTTSQGIITPSTTNSSQYGTGSPRAGLFRTPISGGVQSATSVHDLPPPALAVRNLMEQARFAHLCTVMSRMHHRREGYPFGSLVDFATDEIGHPIFSFSPLAIHTRNLLADPRCTLVVQIPGWSGLSNARVTIFGDVFPLPEEQQEWAHKQYIAKHQQGPSQKWGNFYYFRMQNISDIYFIGGFGTVAWVNVSEYEALRPDKIAVDGGEQNLKELNAIFSKPIKELLSLETEVDDAALISIDSKGTDVRVRQGAQFNIQRLAFEEGHGVETLEEAKAALWNLIHRGGGLKLEHKF